MPKRSRKPRDLNQLGGLNKILPVTGVTALIASLSIAGIPPFSGFSSKWLIFATSVSAGILLPMFLIFGLVAIGMVLQTNGLVGEVTDTIVFMGDVQSNHVNLTMQDSQKIERLEEEVFKKEEPMAKITNDTIEYYDLEYLVVRENMSGNVMVFGDFNADGSHVEWDSSVMYSVLEDTNESITIRMEKQ